MSTASPAGDRGSPGTGYPDGERSRAEGGRAAPLVIPGKPVQSEGAGPTLSTTTFPPKQNPAKKLASGASHRPAGPRTVWAGSHRPGSLHRGDRCPVLPNTLNPGHVHKKYAAFYSVISTNDSSTPPPPVSMRPSLAAEAPQLREEQAEQCPGRERVSDSPSSPPLLPGPGELCWGEARRSQSQPPPPHPVQRNLNHLPSSGLDQSRRTLPLFVFSGY